MGHRSSPAICVLLFFPTYVAYVSDCKIDCWVDPDQLPDAQFIPPTPSHYKKRGENKMSKLMGQDQKRESLIVYHHWKNKLDLGKELIAN